MTKSLRRNRPLILFRTGTLCHEAPRDWELNCESLPARRGRIKSRG